MTTLGIPDIPVGQVERLAQDRVIELFTDQLGYAYLGNWKDREGNTNVEENLLEAFLSSKYSAEQTRQAIRQLRQAADDRTHSLYDRNKTVYTLLRYGAKVQETGKPPKTVWLIDWKQPENNHFAIAEEVTLSGGGHKKRPDIVLYINGIAVGVLELKRSRIAVEEGIRQSIDSQKPEFIEDFFATNHLIMAGNDTQGLRYAPIEARQKFYMTWKEPTFEQVASPLDRGLLQLCAKDRLLDLIHNFTVFDAGTKKLPRHNQHFGVKAAQAFVQRRDGGIIWQTQGSGKSLVMVWLARWIRENVGGDPRVLIVTDRIELDRHIQDVFQGVGEQITRVSGGDELIHHLNQATPPLLCSLIHKFGSQRDDENKAGYDNYIEELKKALPAGFEAKGNIFVFIDECHRTQSGVLHEALETVLPDATLIGFTGTPLLSSNKKRSIEVFGPYIHTYKFDEAVADGVIVDLKYEARDISQQIANPVKIDEWFEAKTAGLSELGKAQVKRRWGTIREISSSRSRLTEIAKNILFDMEVRPRLASDKGNAILVSSSIYEACIFYELFTKGGLKGKCAIVTSYRPQISDIKGEDAGEGETEAIEKFETYKQMLADWFGTDPESALNRVEEFEEQVIAKFEKDPGQVKLLIVVDKLLTGFDAPPATYLYIDKPMRDHGLFQAVCRVNRIHTEDKEYGYIIDYQDLFKSLEEAYADYTSEALDGYSSDDVQGLLSDRIAALKRDLEDSLEQLKSLCEPVDPEGGLPAYIAYFCSPEGASDEQIAADIRKRQLLYSLVARAARTFAELAPDHKQAGYSTADYDKIREEVARYEDLRQDIRLASADVADLKAIEPGMRFLIDNYIKSGEMEELAKFDDSLVEMFAKLGPKAVKHLPKSLGSDENSTAEAIEANIRRLIIDESQVNPRYYEKMSKLLADLIEQRQAERISYQEYLKQIAELAEKVLDPALGDQYPAQVNTPELRALYLTLNRSEDEALAVDAKVRKKAQDGWRENRAKTRRVRKAIQDALEDASDDAVDEILELVKHRGEY
jgi:type I restriction enzyme R subunit